MKIVIKVMFNIITVITFLMFANDVFADANEVIASIKADTKLNKKTAVMVIDMQTHYEYAFVEQEKVIEEQLKVIKYAAKNNLPIVDVNIDDFSPTLDRLLLKMQRSTMYELFNKTQESAFGIENGEEALNTYLRSKGVQKIYMMGCFDTSCVLKTVEDALNLDYEVVVDRGLNIHAPNEKNFKWRDLKIFNSDKLTVLEENRSSSCNIL
ncbi:hypothetical protein AB835_00765 [Candidatus Endobugula sertula]|uniref:Isochorismatase-like domain-containing protein n=1 Tax=Candidatus Endobugula sertula TaxID=62101 RepID=A0A1D2QU55_9GAMM|nr:hypothetical protein AB835_00765 [Candidatus Endobugula sertula]